METIHGCLLRHLTAANALHDGTVPRREADSHESNLSCCLAVAIVTDEACDSSGSIDIDEASGVLGDTIGGWGAKDSVC